MQKGGLSRLSWEWERSQFMYRVISDIPHRMIWQRIGLMRQPPPAFEVLPNDDAAAIADFGNFGFEIAVVGKNADLRHFDFLCCSVKRIMNWSVVFGCG